MLRRIAATVLSGLLLAALAVAPASAQAPLGEWTIAGIAGDPVTGAPTLTIAADGYSGSSGCNRFFGSVTVEGPAITFGPAGTTRMMCADRALMDQEAALLAAFASIKTWLAAGNELHFLNDAGVPVIVLTAAETANAIVIPVPDPVTVETHTYRCGDLSLTVDYITAGPVALALLHFPDETIVAANMFFADGTRFVGGRYTLWLHGVVDLWDLAEQATARWIPCTPVEATAR